MVRFRDLRGHGLGHALDVNFRPGLAGAFGDGVGHRFNCPDHQKAILREVCPFRVAPTLQAANTEF